MFRHWDELIPSEHVVRVVNRAIDKINLEPLLKRYKVGGTSSYHPRMMLKVLVYAYTQRIYSPRQMAKPLRKNVNFKQKIAELNQRLKEKPEDKKLAKAVKVMEKDYPPRQKRYEEQERKLAGRNSYSKTDEDATFFRMKEDRGAEKPLPKPAYNVQTGTEGQFVVGFSLHQRAGDTACLVPIWKELRPT